ncbi:hypothetical protein HMPREF7215_1153 [Pyramidobacter piscolens W5455]|uniref:Uncharacterized protein n=1 Tax=Pyramidobacter piscolens W5455 TaxID=352165 RepID=A0ABM9ZVA6_9BACT|nr:hypothetical protein HMPREF7215_1153 [Pyramidobacter piscolens W5455]
MRNSIIILFSRHWWNKSLSVNLVAERSYKMKYSAGLIVGLCVGTAAFAVIVMLCLHC